MKKPLSYAVLAVFALNHAVYAQEAIEIEIDSAPVEVEIPAPATPAQEPQPPAQTAEVEEPVEETSGKSYGLAIGIGALVAGALAALAGGGGGGTDSTTSHSTP